MNDDAIRAESQWADALLASQVFAVDPQGIVGVVVAAQAGPVRETWLKGMRSLLPDAMPMRRLPAHIPDSRLLGGLDLVATLNTGRPVVERGLLAEADQGVILLPMAERISSALIGRLVAVLDTHEVALERDGLALRLPARLAVIALNEGVSAEEQPSPALLDRLALHVNLDGLRFDVDLEDLPGRQDIVAAQARLPDVIAPPEMIEALCTAALVLGIHSSRAPLLALRVARASAALVGRATVTTDDVSLAARLVLAARATQLPAQEPAEQSPEQEQEQEQEQSPGEPQLSTTPDSTANDNKDDSNTVGELEEQVIESARAAIPAGLLATLGVTGTLNPRMRSVGKAGAFQASERRGRPAGVRKGPPRSGVALNVVETLRAAAPWQRLRKQQAPRKGAAGSNARIDVRAEDFHVTRYRHRTETTTVFVLDASGSTALQRFGEAKGAVELLLADCYVRRDQVAVLAFRGRSAEVLLPPTRSLVRAKRSLGSLPGGGGTPLAAGIEAAMVLADSLRRRGTLPTVVLLTDGRGNVARDGSTGRAVAEEDALRAAARMKFANVSVLLIDTSARPQPQAQRLAAAMGARYVPLPHASSKALARAVQVANG
jgi:magnesium chelatase subunit D